MEAVAGAGRKSVRVHFADGPLRGVDGTGVPGHSSGVLGVDDQLVGRTGGAESHTEDPDEVVRPCVLGC